VPRERAIRAALRPVALDGVASAGGRLVEEFWIPRLNVRADMVAVGDRLDGYEIKSAADSLRRLPGQVAAFARVFDQCTAVVAAKHESAALEIVPEWWGVVVVEHGTAAVLAVRRSPCPNPSVDVELLVRLLWRDEVLAVLLEYGVQPNVAGGRSAMWRQLLDTLSPSAIRTAVRQALHSREQWFDSHGKSRFSQSLAPAR
jgi:hypothetical protein